MPLDLGSFLIQLFSGLSRAMMLFLVSSGLSLIFGVMNILNFAHATFWLLGGYLTYTMFQFCTSIFGDSGLVLVPAIILATMIMFALGWLVERFLIRRMYGRELPEQLLLTFALILIISDLIKLIWGVQNKRIFIPIEPLEVLDAFINPYFFVVIAAGFGVAAGLWWFLHRTKYGKIVRAAVFSREMVSALGIRIPTIYAGVFALGVGIAAFSAGVFLPIMPIGLGIDMDLIIQCFAVVVIGGFGSILGTFVASLIVGIVYSFSILLWPGGALAIIFLILVAVLIWRPWGLFGTEMRY
ncbi:MAG: branched-chain amino acid ABC transporter permease [Deltaproteobacteria bacterium]|nr:branched-chain amino acid ABC transporter permease [Deltaproteobacteria bacterium]MBW2071877.1 branched-chain amino acid ABC transporter permease [Deltaproteobacteria bacterium]